MVAMEKYFISTMNLEGMSNLVIELDCIILEKSCGLAVLMVITVIRSHVQENLTIKQDLKTVLNGISVGARCSKSMLLGDM